LAIEEQRLAHRHDEEIVQVFALCGQQCGIKRAAGRDLGHVVRYQPLQEWAAIRSGDFEHAAILEDRTKSLNHCFTCPRRRSWPTRSKRGVQPWQAARI